VGTLRPGAKNNFTPPRTKTLEFEVKNRSKSAEEAKIEHLLLVTSVIFRSKNTFYARYAHP